MVEPTPRPLHLFYGGLLGGLLGIVAFILVPNLVGEATDSAGLKRFTDEDVITTGATLGPPGAPRVWEGRLAEPDWETPWRARTSFRFAAETTNASGDGRVQVEVTLSIQGHNAARWVEKIGTDGGAGLYTVRGRHVDIDTTKPLSASAALRVQRYSDGGADWTITIRPLEFRQDTQALDTDHDGVPQPLQPLEGLPSYFLSMILALIGVNAAYLYMRQRRGDRGP